ncbi:MAG TPA: choice-of-anchor U domain-containing protein, partial [Nocardioides sp.]|nr:choice-of-anchor U domain-containing protein [Nocardioides sp.]
DVNDATVGNFDFQRNMTLSDGDHLALAPDLDFLELYLLGPTGDPGTGSATLSCSGDNGDVNSFTSTVTTRSGTGQLRLPGYADDGGSCSLAVTWADNTVVNRQVTLDPNVDTAVTLLRNGVTLNSDPFTSKDDDGVADALEAYAPNMGDGDSDGSPDYLQADVASLPENGGVLGSPEKDYLTVAGPDGSEMFSVATDDVAGARVAWGRGSQAVAGPPDGTQLPKGFLDFEVRNVTPGSTKKVVIYYDSTAGMNSYSTYNPANGAWSQLPADRVKINSTSIELTLTDGGIGDVDGEVNGRVRHPGGGSRVDADAPVVSGRVLTPPNDKGWYDGSVTVRWTVTDDQANIAAPPDTVVSAEGDDVTATSAQVCDKRGNCSTGMLQHLKIDKTPPTVTIDGPADGATYTLGAVPARRCTSTDPGGAGVPGGSCDVTVSGGTSAGVGTVTVSATATDRAGNTRRKTLTYTVVYDAGGLVAPASGSKLKVFKQGSTVVVRLKIRDDGGATVTPAKAPVWVKPVAKGKASGKPNQPVSDAKPDKGSVLIKRGQFWEYRWGTDAAKKGKSYVLTVRLDDGTSRTVTVGIN